MGQVTGWWSQDLNPGVCCKVQALPPLPSCYCQRVPNLTTVNFEVDWPSQLVGQGRPWCRAGLRRIGSELAQVGQLG